MKISVVTAFPDVLKNYLSCSVLGKGIEAGKLEVQIIDLRDFGRGEHRQIDDYSFGGGGMVLMKEPLERALDEDSYVVFPSPQGVLLCQEIIEALFKRAEDGKLLIICGHYEGADERFIKKHVDIEVSLGDFVLTGGELAAMAIIDGIARLIPGVVGRFEAVEGDSFYKGMLDHPHYTRPYDDEVPAVLTQGNASEIALWRKREAVRRTVTRRPDLLSVSCILDYISPPCAAFGDSFKIEDLLCSIKICQLYGIEKIFLIGQDKTRREALKAVKDELGGRIKICAGLDRHFKDALIINGSRETIKNWLPLKKQVLEHTGQSVFVFEECEDMPNAACAAIVLDRFFRRFVK